MQLLKNKKMKNLITICARGGSKGIPGKNIKKINGQPLLAYTINTAKLFSKMWNADIALSTDDQQIKNVASDFGIVTNYTRPDTLANDTAGKIDTIKDILLFQENQLDINYDFILDLDVTSPLRTIDDLQSAFKILNADSNAYNLFSVSHAVRNPYFNIVEKKNNNYYNVIKEGDFLSRQSAPEVYDMNSSFYFYRKSFFEHKQTKTTCEKSLIYIMPHLCFDLDHQFDFDYMEFLLINKKLNFEI